MVCKSYGVKEEELLYSKRWMGKKARNMAIFLLRPMKGSKMEEIGREFGMSSYSTVSKIIERIRNEVVNERRLRRHIEQLKHDLKVSQEQT